MIDKVISIALTLKGGRGSGYFGHRGRPGEVGGSGRGVSIGMTSARPDRSDESVVMQDMKNFSDELFRKGVKVTASRKAWGAWVSPEGNDVVMEPSWYMRYLGNGEAIKTIAEAAEKYNQDAVILWHETDEDDPDSVPRIAFVFPEMSKEDVKSINSIISQHGLPGWTWDINRKAFVSAAVSQWGDPIEFARTAVNVANALRSSGFKMKAFYSHVKSTVLDRSNYEQYKKGVVS